MSVNEFDHDEPISPRLPQAWTWGAALLILVLGAAGFVRGATGSRPLRDMLAPVKGRLPAAVALTAADAAAMPHNDDWSVLSGPKILPPPVAKPVQVAKDDADSDEPDDQSAAAADVDAQALDNAATPDDKPDAPGAGATRA